MRTIAAALILVGATLACITGLAQPRVPAAMTFRVIVHPENPATHIKQKDLADSFLKRSTRWPDGEAIRPVDQGVSSKVREIFVDQVLHKSIGAVKSYWQQQIFSGRGVPPPELDSDQAIIQYVLAHRGAVGYVSGTANIGNAKLLIIE